MSSFKCGQCLQSKTYQICLEGSDRNGRKHWKAIAKVRINGTAPKSTLLLGTKIEPGPASYRGTARDYKGNRRYPIDYITDTSKDTSKATTMNLASTPLFLDETASSRTHRSGQELGRPVYSHRQLISPIYAPPSKQIGTLKSEVFTNPKATSWFQSLIHAGTAPGAVDLNGKACMQARRDDKITTYQQFIDFSIWFHGHVSANPLPPQLAEEFWN
ncbi:hypothetical protein F5887DRAFT_1157776 [Amanita rubescens]|nr:hypothetical protein F5887DRAFT_1157776 [Amanita rubescens]